MEIVLSGLMWLMGYILSWVRLHRWFDTFSTYSKALEEIGPCM